MINFNIIFIFKTNEKNNPMETNSIKLLKIEK